MQLKIINESNCKQRLWEPIYFLWSISSWHYPVQRESNQEAWYQLGLQHATQSHVLHAEAPDSRSRSLKNLPVQKSLQYCRHMQHAKKRNCWKHLPGNILPLLWCFIVINWTAGIKECFESQYRAVRSTLRRETSRLGERRVKRRVKGKETGGKGKEEKKKWEGWRKKRKSSKKRDDEERKKKRKQENLTVTLLIRKACLCTKMRAVAQKSCSHSYSLPRWIQEFFKRDGG